MIANHTQFTAAIEDRKKVCVRFYSTPDSGVLDRVCAPMEYGPGENPDGLNRYWIWDYDNEAGPKSIGLMPKQILDLQVLGLRFDPVEFTSRPALSPPATGGAVPGSNVVPTSAATIPIL